MTNTNKTLYKNQGKLTFFLKNKIKVVDLQLFNEIVIYRAFQ